jgi:hypothetical protein
MAATIPKSEKRVDQVRLNTTQWFDTIPFEVGREVISSANEKGRMNIEESDSNVGKICAGLTRLLVEMRRRQEINGGDLSLSTRPADQRKYLETVDSAATRLIEVLDAMGETSHALLHSKGAFRKENGRQYLSGSRELLTQVEEVRGAARAALASLKGQKPRLKDSHQWLIRELAVLYSEVRGKSACSHGSYDTPFERFAKASATALGLDPPTTDQLRHAL